MENKFKVTVRPAAASEFATHIEFLSRKSIRTANAIIDDFEKLESILSERPASFPIFYKNYRKANIPPRYAVLFEIVGNKVFVDKIIDMRQTEYNDIINELSSEVACLSTDEEKRTVLRRPFSYYLEYDVTFCVSY